MGESAINANCASFDNAYFCYGKFLFDPILIPLEKIGSPQVMALEAQEQIDSPQPPFFLEDWHGYGSRYIYTHKKQWKLLKSRMCSVIGFKFGAGGGSRMKLPTLSDNFIREPPPAPNLNPITEH